MLKSINKRYLIFGILAYLLISALNPPDMKLLYLVNGAALISFAMLIHYVQQRPDGFFTQKNLLFIVFAYVGIYVFCYNLLSFYYTDNLYIFSENDALYYHKDAITMSEMPFFDSIAYFLSYREVEDLGISLVLSCLYRIAASKIMLSIFYVFVGTLTALSIFNISKRFMSVKYAFLCAIAYSVSSYVIWFHSSGLKESLLIWLVTLFYGSYYRLTFDKKLSAVWGLIVTPLLIMMFRPVLSLFCLASLAIGIAFRKKLTVPQLVFLVGVMLAGIYFLEPIIGSTDKFLLGGTESMLEIKQMEGMIKGSVSFSYLVNTLASMFGPFPSLLSSKVHLTFFAPGLIFKVFVSIGFWFGVVHILKAKMTQAYPMLFFVLVEMASLTYILEALELRKSLPHFPLVYIVAFIFIYRFDHNQLLTVKNHLLYKKSFQVMSIVLCFLMVYWNFR